MNPNDAYRLSKFRMAELHAEAAANRLASDARKSARSETQVVTPREAARRRRHQSILRRLAAWPLSIQLRGTLTASDERR